jgi:3-hydroxyisobutyrate dehydrogenase
MAGEKTIAVLGAGGVMGLPIARNLARAGFEVRAWNRSREKTEPLTDDGVEVVASPAEAAEGAGAVLTILSDAEAVIGVMAGTGGTLSAMGEDAIWIQASTIGEQGTERCIALAVERGIAFVDSPVLGTKAPAEQGKLLVLASGRDEDRDRVAPIFDVIGARTMWVGEAGKGTLLKLVSNTWILALVEGSAEALALAEGVGLDPKLLLEAVAGGALDLPYLQMKGTAIMERNFEPSFRLALAAKDARLVEETARRHDLDLPLVTTIRERLDEGSREHGQLDMCATYLTSAPS